MNSFSFLQQIPLNYACILNPVVWSSADLNFTNETKTIFSNLEQEKSRGKSNRKSKNLTNKLPDFQFCFPHEFLIAAWRKFSLYFYIRTTFFPACGRRIFLFPLNYMRKKNYHIKWGHAFEINFTQTFSGMLIRSEFFSKLENYLGLRNEFSVVYRSFGKSQSCQFTDSIIF